MTRSRSEVTTRPEAAGTGADTDIDPDVDVAEERFPRLVPWLLVVGGALGFVAAFVLTVEKITLLQDPDYVPSCSINPILSCGSVMSTPQAEAFGFPNPLIGIAAFAVVVTVGVARLAGATLPRWFWLGMQLGTTFGVVFVHWLIVQSLYRIGALCPYCMVVWAVTVPLFWYVTVHNLDRRHLPVPSGARRMVRTVVDYHSVPVIAWFFVVAGMIVVRFWSFWVTLF